MKSVDGITSDSVGCLPNPHLNAIGDRPSHPIHKVPPPQGLPDEIRQFRMPKFRFPKAPESGCWGSKRIASQVLFETLLRSG